MGAGSFPAGVGPAGFDPVQQTVPAPIPPLPAAVNYDATLKGRTQNADGTFLEVHPVDQQVQMLLTIERGSVPALGDVGQRYRARLVGVAPDHKLSVIQDETRVTLKKLLDAGDVKILRVTFAEKIVRVDYVNLRASQKGTQTVRSAVSH